MAGLINVKLNCILFQTLSSSPKLRSWSFLGTPSISPIESPQRQVRYLYFDGKTDNVGITDFGNANKNLVKSEPVYPAYR